MAIKTRVENFIIPRPNTATPTAGDRLYDLTTDAINLVVGGFGVYTGTVNSGNPTALDPAAVSSSTQDFIKFIQRRDDSNIRTPLTPRVFEESPDIFANCFLRSTGRAAEVKRNSSWMIGEGSGPGIVPINDETEYIMNSGLRGWKVDLYNGNNTPYKQGRFTTPDYTLSTQYTIDAQQRDHLLHNLAADYNQQGQMESVVICIDSAATASLTNTNVITLATAAALNPGDSIIIGFSDVGQPIRLVIDADLKETFTKIIDVSFGNIPSTSQIIPYALATTANTGVATRLIAGGRVAGVATSTVDRLLFIALDPTEATYEEAYQNKSRIQVGLEAGFSSSTFTDHIVTPNEGSGYYDEILQYYRDTAGHRAYIGNKPWQQYFVEYGTELTPGAIYDVYFIDSCEQRTASSGLPSISPQRTVIPIANFTTTGFALFTGVANAQKAYAQTTINNWMNSTTYPHTNLAL